MAHELSDYELLREANIREKQAFLARIKIEHPIDDLPESAIGTVVKQEMKETVNEKRYSRKRLIKEVIDFIPVRRSSRLKRCSVDYNGEDDGEQDLDMMKVVKKKRPLVRIRMRQNRQSSPRVVPSVDEITPSVLARIAKNSSKVYSTTSGQTCHQCRQKTLDTKTVCRSPDCVGVRGQFCGTCLSHRYGEDPVAALLDPKWICPPCRNMCNCSICRNRTGKAATGILTPSAFKHGFKSVHDYLIANGDNDSSEYESDNQEEEANP